MQSSCSKAQIWALATSRASMYPPKSVWLIFESELEWITLFISSREVFNRAAALSSNSCGPKTKKELIADSLNFISFLFASKNSHTNLSAKALEAQ